MKLLKRTCALFFAICMCASFCLGAGANNFRTPTGKMGSYNPFRAIDDIVVLKGTPHFSESKVGAHYYAFSGQGTNYSEAFANIKLPTSFNNAGNTRNGFVALGIAGQHFGIDMGLINTGSGWFPVCYDVSSGNEHRFESYKAPSTATNAVIVVKPVTTTSVHMYVQFLNSSGVQVGDVFDKDITVQAENLQMSGGKVICRFYRFASLVNIDPDVDNQKDSSYMLGGQFTNLALYNRNTSSYETWGINTARVTTAWLCSPERISLTYTSNSDTFNIDHWSGR